MTSFHQNHSGNQSRLFAAGDGIKPGLICVGVFAFAIATAFGLNSANPARSITAVPPAGAPAGVSFGGHEPVRAAEPTELFPVLGSGGPAFGFVIFDWPAEAGIAGFAPRPTPQP